MNVFEGLPATIRIGAYDWKLDVVPEMKDDDGSDLAGTCEERGFVIQLNASSEIHPIALTALETVIHEITHSVFYSAHITKGDTEERVCLSMGTVWTQILRDNPQLVSWIVSTLGK